MSFDGALVTEQGVTFAIVCVKPYVLRSGMVGGAAEQGKPKWCQMILIEKEVKDARIGQL